MATTHRSLVALATVCAALVVNAFALSPWWILAPAERFSQTVAVPAFAWSQAINWVLLTLLVPLVPALVGTGPRRALPGWFVPVVQVVIAAQAATHMVQGLVMRWLLPLAPEVIDLTTDGGALQIVLITVWVLFLVTMVTFAAMLWRAGHSRVGALLVMIGAVATPAVGPFGAGLVALGLLVVVVTALRAGAAAGTRQGAAVPAAV